MSATKELFSVEVEILDPGEENTKKAAAAARIRENKKAWTSQAKAMVMSIRARIITWAKAVQADMKEGVPAKGKGVTGKNLGLAKKQIYRKIPTPDWGKNRVFGRVRMARRGYIPVNYGTKGVRKTKKGYTRGTIQGTTLLQRSQQKAMDAVSWYGVSDEAMAWVRSHPNWTDAQYGSSMQEENG